MQPPQPPSGALSSLALMDSLVAAGTRGMAVDAVATALLSSDSNFVVTLTVGPLLRRAGLTVDEVLQVKRVLQVIFCPRFLWAL